MLPVLIGVALALLLYGRLRWQARRWISCRAPPGRAAGGQVAALAAFHSYVVRMAEVFEEPRRLADFLRERRDEILEAWTTAVREVGAARDLPRPLLIDHMPQFIEDLAHYVDDLRAGHTASPPQEQPRVHAIERLEVGYDLAEVVAEYAVLRRCITELAVGAAAVRSAELPRLHAAIDQAIATSVVRYTEARERTLRALDRIASAALVHDDVELLLPRTMEAFLETTASADSVALVMAHDGELRVRAAVGFPEPSPLGAIVPDGAFSARVARARLPFLLRDASADPEAARSPTCAPGTRALYGVPLMLGEELVGVAVMGSRSNYEFSEEDQFLFRTMAHRMTGLIHQAELRATLAEQADELRAALDFRDRILGVLSHDLRNPLSVILTSAQTLQRRAADEQMQRQVRRVIANAQRIERMVHDLLDYTRTRQGLGIPLTPSEADLVPICKQVIDNMQVLHSSRSIELRVEGDTRGAFDPDRTAQVVANLLTNAIHYSPQSSAVRVTVRGEEDGLVLEVHNEGPPIPTDLMPRLFEAFQRGVKENGPTAGLGLGLYIVEQIVEAQGGSIEVRSKDGDGTMFTVRLPRRAATG
jgi:K+-sensing histidine kinase KdpD